MSDFVPIRHDGRKPDWLSQEDKIWNAAGGASDAGFIIAAQANWQFVGGWFLPADHWAAPVLLAGLEPWNPTLQGEGPPAEYDGGRVFFREAGVNVVEAIWDWEWANDVNDIIGFERAIPTQQQPDGEGVVIFERAKAIAKKIIIKRHLQRNNGKIYTAALEAAETALKAEATHIEALTRRLAQAETDRDAALRECTRFATEAGEAQGRLEMSEAAGIVDGWREKCEGLERMLRIADGLFAEAMNHPDGQYLWLFGDEGIDAWQSVRAELHGFTHEPLTETAKVIIRQASVDSEG